MGTTQTQVDEIRLLHQKAFTPVDEKLWHQLVPWLLHRQEIAKEMLKCKDGETLKLLYQTMDSTESAIKEVLGMYKPFLM